MNQTARSAPRGFPLFATVIVSAVAGVLAGAMFMHVLTKPDGPSSSESSELSDTARTVSDSGISADSSDRPAAPAIVDRRTANPTVPYLFVLGVTQDAGYPQAGCYEPHCMPGWQTPGGQRGAVSLGLVTASKKYLFEATPNLPAQLYALEMEALTDTHPLSGVFITHAHIGHYAGLMFFGHEAMGATALPVYAMPRMEQFLRTNGPWNQLVDFDNIALRSLSNQQAVRIDGVTVTPFVVPHRDEYSETVGFRIEGSNTSAVFIPDINKWGDWSEDLTEVIRSTDYALIDAAFYADGELPGRDMSRIPHPFVSETMALLDAMDAVERDKVWFIHMNHTNPLLRPDSEESRRVEQAGYHIAREGVRLFLP